MTREQAARHRRDTGKFADGFGRCTDCRCSNDNNPTCPGETIVDRDGWESRMKTDMMGWS